MSESRYKEKEKSISMREAQTPSEIHDAIENIRKRARLVKETNRRRLSRYGR
jgi:hypothetical protein